MKLTLVPRDKWIDERVLELMEDGMHLKYAAKRAVNEKRSGDERILAYRQMRRENK